MLFLHLFVDGLVSGCAIGIVAVTFTLIYTTTRVFHLAHAAIYTLAGYAAWYLTEHEGLVDDDARREWMIETAGVPAGRLGEPTEIASTIVYLCSQQAGYVNGHYIAVDGGLHRSAF